MRHAEKVWKDWKTSKESTSSVRGTSLWTDGDHIYSYGTIILARVDNWAGVLNVTSYSRTTTKHQRWLRLQLETDAPACKITEVTGVPMGESHESALFKLAETSGDKRSTG